MWESVKINRKIWAGNIAGRLLNEGQRGSKAGTATKIFLESIEDAIVGKKGKKWALTSMVAQTSSADWEIRDAWTDLEKLADEWQKAEAQ